LCCDDDEGEGDGEWVADDEEDCWWHDAAAEADDDDEAGFNMIGSGVMPSLTKCTLERWCRYAPLDMNGVSQKAHFMIESAVTTASLQAQLNANIAPGAVLPVMDVGGDMDCAGPPLVADALDDERLLGRW